MPKPDGSTNTANPTLAAKIRQQLSTLPKKPGCYLLRDSDGTVLYVGKAKVLRSRVRSYFVGSPNFTNPAKFSMVRQVTDIETIVVGSEMEALILESILIKKYEPRYNVVLKDDKHYLFIKVTVQEDYPRVETVRRVSRDGARYFGPFTNSFAVRDTLRLLQRIFPYRTCDLDLQVSGSPGSRAATGTRPTAPQPAGSIKSRGYRPCLRYHMGRCDAPCIEGISREDYRAIIDKIILFLEGKLDFVVEGLRREMHAAAREQLFERAARLRDQISQIEHLTAKQVVLSPRFTNQDVIGLVTDRERTRAFASLMMIRDGKVLGQEHFVLNITSLGGRTRTGSRDVAAEAGGGAPGFVGSARHIDVATEQEVVRRLVVEHYEQATFIPKQLIVPVRLSDQSALEQLLRRRALSLNLEHKPRIVVPRTGLNKRLLAMAQENAQEFRSRKTHEWENRELNLSAALGSLATVLGLRDASGRPQPPQRVEIYDISNIQGTAAVGSMVVFEQGRPAKAEYRRFKIASLKEEPNDVGMLKEVLRRRLKRLPELAAASPAAPGPTSAATTDTQANLRAAGDARPSWPRPDLIIVDGGKPQLGAALSVLSELDLDIPVAALAKQHEELFVPQSSSTSSQTKKPAVPPPGANIASRVSSELAGVSSARVVRFAEGTSALHLVQRMRDEAHRFAVTFHREVRGARGRRSLLDEIVGIGPARKKLLIQKYGSLSAIADASETELATLIGAKAARALTQQLR